MSNGANIPRGRRWTVFDTRSVTVVPEARAFLPALFWRPVAEPVAASGLEAPRRAAGRTPADRSVCWFLRPFLACTVITPGGSNDVVDCL